eukprot:4353517-Pleurochrysis_carterae.AAC.1
MRAQARRPTPFCATISSGSLARPTGPSSPPPPRSASSTEGTSSKRSRSSRPTCRRPAHALPSGRAVGLTKRREPGSRGTEARTATCSGLDSVA